jgi:hypothetical protein
VDKSESNSHSSKTTETPSGPPSVSWAINQRLKRAQQSYLNDQKQSSGIAGILDCAKRLVRYVEEIKGIYWTEIDAGRLVDAAELWAALYNYVLVWVNAQKTSIVGNSVLELMRANGGGPGEQASVEEAQRELSRLVAEVEGELANASAVAAQEEASASTPQRPALQNHSAFVFRGSASHDKDGSAPYLLSRV